MCSGCSGCTGCSGSGYGDGQTGGACSGCFGCTGCGSACGGSCNGCSGCHGCNSCSGSCQGCTNCTGQCLGCSSCSGQCLGCISCTSCVACTGTCSGYCDNACTAANQAGVISNIGISEIIRLDELQYLQNLAVNELARRGVVYDSAVLNPDDVLASQAMAFFNNMARLGLRQITVNNNDTIIVASNYNEAILTLKARMMDNIRR
jgi:Uncharacterized conserved protein